MNMKKYILIGLILVLGQSLTMVEAQNMSAQKKEKIEQTMFNMNYVQALKDVNAELINYPEDYDLNLFKAICYTYIPEHRNEAVAAYDLALTKAKTNYQKHEALYYLAVYYCEMGNKAKSIETLNLIINSGETIDECSLELIERLMKSACISDCDDAKWQEKIAEIENAARVRDSLNNKKISDLNNKINELENRAKNNSDISKMTTTNDNTRIVKRIADPLQPISADGYYKLHFAFDESDLDKESKDILDRFVIFLNDNKDLKVNCVGHADIRGTYEVNQTISKERSTKAKNYLVAKGISEDRIVISYTGYTEPEVIDQYIARSHPVFKIGDTLTNEFIDNLSGEKKTKAHQLNRRVELNIIK